MPKNTKKNRPQPLLMRYLRYLGIFATAIGVGFLMYYFSSIVTWVVLAWVISLLGSPLVNLLGRIRYKDWTLPSSIRAIIVLLFFYSILFLMFYIFVPTIARQARQLAKVDYKAVITSLEDPINTVNDWLIKRGLIEGMVSDKAAVIKNTEETLENLDSNNVPSIVPLPKLEPVEQQPLISVTSISMDSFVLANGNTMPRTNINLNLALNLETVLPVVTEDSAALIAIQESPRTQEADRMHEQLKQMFTEYLSPSTMVTRSVVYVISWLGNILVLITSVTFIAFFFLKDEKLFGRVIKALVPRRRLHEMDTALITIRRLLTRYFSGILVQITLITLYVTVLLSFFGVPNAFLIAFFAAVVNVIPYLGPFIGAMFATLVIISANIDASFYDVTFPMLLKAGGVFVSMQIVDGFILQPYIFSNSVSAHPLEIFIVVVIGAKLGGITGMIVAIPVYTIIRVIAAVFLKEFHLVQKLTQSINYREDDSHIQENVDIEVES